MAISVQRFIRRTLYLVLDRETTTKVQMLNDISSKTYEAMKQDVGSWSQKRIIEKALINNTWHWQKTETKSE